MIQNPVLDSLDTSVAAVSNTDLVIPGIRDIQIGLFNIRCHSWMKMNFCESVPHPFDIKLNLKQIWYNVYIIISSVSSFCRG